MGFAWSLLGMGLLFIILGVLFARTKKLKINAWVGYRTYRSMSSPEAWVKANNYSGRCLIVIGLITVILGFIMFLLGESILWGLIFIHCPVIGAFISIFLTERYLKREFEENEDEKKLSPII